MKIEKGIQCDCSELIARLYPADTEDELHKLLHELEKVTDWTVGIQASGDFPQDFDDIVDEVKSCLMGQEEERTKISRTISIEEVELGELFEDDREIIYDPEKLEEPYSKFFKENSWDRHGKHARVLLLRDMKENNVKIGDQIDGVEITQKDRKSVV